MERMGFKEAKRKVLESIDDGSIRHETRSDIDQKNLLHSGQVTTAEVRELITRSRGNNYESREHHWMDGVEIHILKAKTWYIKWYFLDPNAVFVSIHE